MCFCLKVFKTKNSKGSINNICWLNWNGSHSPQDDGSIRLVVIDDGLLILHKVLSIGVKRNGEVNRNLKIMNINCSFDFY